LYAQQCSSCHEPDLTGNEVTPQLAGGDFAANWNDQTLDQLFDRIRTTMPLDKVGSLSRQQTADILAYMLRSSRAPAGAADLSTQSDVLHTIKYLATNPKAE
jgi:mono/diheme cytochrome c family protein